MQKDICITKVSTELCIKEKEGRKEEKKKGGEQYANLTEEE